VFLVRETSRHDDDEEISVSEVKLSAQPRNEFGKGAARRLRRDHLVPAVLYGHGTDPVHVALPGHQVALLIRRANVVLELDVNGTQQLTLVKDVQKDPVHQIIEHIDLLVVKKGEKIQVDIPIVIIGESAPGTIANLDAVSISLEVEATHIPQNIELDIEGLEDGTHITAADLTLPKGAVLVADPETLVVAISVPSSAGDADDIEAADAAVAAGQAEESDEAKGSDAE